MNAAINGIPRRFLRLWLVVVSLISTLLLGTTLVSAQTTPIPITVGQNQAGTLADTSVQYSLNVETPQSIEVQVLGISSGLAPRFRILDPNGILLMEAANSAGVTIVEGAVHLTSPGAYLIEVSSANNTPGDFLISVQPGAPLLPPVPLLLGELQNDTVDSETTRQSYSFSGSSTDVLLATVKSDSPTSGVVVALRDADTNEMFGLSNAQLGGVRYRILTGATNYLLEVTFPGGDEAQTYSVCLETESGSVTCAGDGVTVQPVPVNSPAPAASPTIDPNGACTVQSAGAASINVRSGPGTGFGVVAQLPFGSSAPVIGRLADNSWYQVNVSSVIGWVSASVVTLSGNCAGVSVVAPPPVPPTVSAPTQSPTGTTPTTNAPTATLTPTPVADDVAPTSTPSPTPVPTDTGGTFPDLGDIPVFEPVESRPDLWAQVSDVQFMRQVPDGQSPYYLVSIYVRNSGASASGPFTVRLCARLACYDGVSESLNPGYLDSVYITLSAEENKPATIVTIQVALDVYNDVDEANESNNLLTFSRGLP